MKLAPLCIKKTDNSECQKRCLDLRTHAFGDPVLNLHQISENGLETITELAVTIGILTKVNTFQIL